MLAEQCGIFELHVGLLNSIAREATRTIEYRCTPFGSHRQENIPSGSSAAQRMKAGRPNKSV
ncbi:hypothetical protein ALQ89_100683 [Pseudomonas amygdali pv. tabaci]|uniref:Uncharacterized protein n=2 Tax=Pseudomonas amygdali TaxID=47877 RepID=A0AAX1VTH6_PSEAJ|nr:hypothetical protein ALO51_102396 [Pseudomonas amygdali]KPX62862.1 hypothetical protein ALO35_102562 [Pseudomonas amygdali pv. lachrymans]KPY78638.1 hypothetical protein ALO60_102005 [Pseudomonas amygdali pv. tabaci]RMU63800.1 hypothetical protein ALP25_101947 [Pseudomonas syringae pv. syringae]RML79693.1 hypothetical protein ALQ89_100683 [Pseudomonas amygdali pv. tabaci]